MKRERKKKKKTHIEGVKRKKLNIYYYIETATTFCLRSKFELSSYTSETKKKKKKRKKRKKSERIDTTFYYFLHSRSIGLDFVG